MHVTLRSRSLRIPAVKVRIMVQKTLALVNHEVALQEVREVNVLLIDDKAMRSLNKEFRNKDKATDVLSFPQFEPGEVNGTAAAPEVIGSYLGDLVISTQTTLAQAKRFGVTPRAELLRLVVHGILHLCGYDHEGVPKAVAARMRRRERSIRQELS